MRKPLLRTGQLGWVTLFSLVALLAASGTCANINNFHQRPPVGGMTENELFSATGSLGLVLTAIGFAALFVAEIIVRVSKDRSRWPGIALGSIIFTFLCFLLFSLMFPLFAILALAGAFADIVALLILAAPKEHGP